MRYNSNEIIIRMKVIIGIVNVLPANSQVVTAMEMNA